MLGYHVSSRGAGLRRVSADHQVSNFSGVEDGQEFFEFFEHLASVPSSGRLRG